MFELGNEQDKDSLLITTGHQDLVEELSIPGTLTPAKKMRTQGPVDVNDIQNPAVRTFASGIGMDTNWVEAVNMF